MALPILLVNHPDDWVGALMELDVLPSGNGLHGEQRRQRQDRITISEGLLGIENPTWETDPHGVNIGGSGLHIKTADIARFGKMYLQQGSWDGHRRSPANVIGSVEMLHAMIRIISGT